MSEPIRIVIEADTAAEAYDLLVQTATTFRDALEMPLIEREVSVNRLTKAVEDAVCVNNEHHNRAFAEAILAALKVTEVSVGGRR